MNRKSLGQAWATRVIGKPMKRVMVYGDSNSWGYPCDTHKARMVDRWPCVMARALGDIDLIEENLPGRTTVHDDPEHLGEANNGQRFLETALRSHAPLDAVILFLGINDLKARFEPSADLIANNLGRLIEDIRTVGGKSNVWDDPTPPAVFLIAPPALSERADDPTWERCAEWSGARDVSRQLVDACQALGERVDVPVFDATPFVASGSDDPIHWTAASHTRLGNAMAGWLQTQAF